MIELFDWRKLRASCLRQITELSIKEFLETVGDRERRSCSIAQLAHEPLPDDCDQSRRDKERINTHVDETRDRTERSIGVDRREHEVAGKRSLHRKHGSLFIADLADHDDVRVLTKDGAQPAREGVTDLRPYLALCNAGNLIFDRVFE